MIQFVKQLLSVAVVMAASASQAFAVPVVDQQNTQTINASFCTGACAWQQTITAGMSGQLTGVSLVGSGAGNLRIGFDSGFNNGPWEAEVFGATITGNAVIDLSSYGIFVTAGQSFVIDIANLSGSLFGSYSNAAHGQLYLNAPEWNIHANAYGSHWALGYKTYVDVDAAAAAQVPEPASLALLGLGLLGLGAARRRKQ